jgi:hypothetical protein
LGSFAEGLSTVEEASTTSKNRKERKRRPRMQSCRTFVHRLLASQAVSKARHVLQEEKADRTTGLWPKRRRQMRTSCACLDFMIGFVAFELTIPEWLQHAKSQNHITLHSQRHGQLCRMIMCGLKWRPCAPRYVSPHSSGYFSVKIGSYSLKDAALTS